MNLMGLPEPLPTVGYVVPEGTTIFLNLMNKRGVITRVVYVRNDNAVLSLAEEDAEAARNRGPGRAHGRP